MADDATVVIATQESLGEMYEEAALVAFLTSMKAEADCEVLSSDPNFFKHKKEIAVLDCEAEHPWLALYRSSSSDMAGFRRRCGEEQLARQRGIASGGALFDCLPTDLQLVILGELSPRDWGVCAAVCRAWRSYTRHPLLWKQLCEKTWAPRFRAGGVDAVRLEYSSAMVPACVAALDGEADTERWGRRDPPTGFSAEAEQKERLLRDLVIFGSWRNMYICRCRVRFGGVYVGKSTCLSAGLDEGRGMKGYHNSDDDFYVGVKTSVTYRFMRFFENGRFAYLKTPEPPERVLRRGFAGSELGPPSIGAIYEEFDTVNKGGYQLSRDGNLELRTTGVSRRYPHMGSELRRTLLDVHSSLPAKNDALVLRSIGAIFQRNGRIEATELHQPDRVNASTTACVFIPDGESYDAGWGSWWDRAHPRARTSAAAGLRSGGLKVAPSDNGSAGLPMIGAM